MRQFIVAVVSAAAFLLTGCLGNSKNPWTSSEEVKPEQATYLQKAAVKSDSSQNTDNAVESALAWSEKYTTVVEKLAKAQEERRDLEDRHQKSQGQIIKLQADLAACQKELAQANTLLVELQQQLDKWKGNVLGFREEMREAQQAQLEALARVLKLLGGDVPEPTTRPAAKTESASAAKVKK